MKLNLYINETKCCINNIKNETAYPGVFSGPMVEDPNERSVGPPLHTRLLRNKL